MDWIVTYDADCQMNINDMDTFMNEIDSNPDKKVFL